MSKGCYQKFQKNRLNLYYRPINLCNIDLRNNENHTWILNYFKIRIIINHQNIKSRFQNRTQQKLKCMVHKIKHMDTKHIYHKHRDIKHIFQKTKKQDTKHRSIHLRKSYTSNPKNHFKDLIQHHHISPNIKSLDLKKCNKEPFIKHHLNKLTNNQYHQRQVM